MGKVMTHMTMSIDGFIADPQDGIDEIFPWYDAGPIAVPTADERWSFHLDEASAALMRDLMEGAGALVCGRRLFDITQGWGGNHPLGTPVVVVTHRPPDDADDEKWKRFTFVDGVEPAVTQARKIAGDRDVILSSADICAQALDLGLVDEVNISLAPVLTGAGIPYFANLTKAPHRFEDPVVIQGLRATHLRFAVRRDEPDGH
jgi:dihydrofolate reductase